MKQQASSESLELQVKHARIDDKLPRPIDLTYNLLAPEWLDNEPGVWTKDWTEFWTGRFRKVSIDVVVHTNPDGGDASTKFVRLAEMLATRLVGLGGTVTCEDSYTAYPDIGSQWIRCVTVERKA
ncbi:hypothetical protein HBI25_052250 [Parastagonospora nodorum]|nr:hypothetical protein HBH49_084850 [Parastagonospora nodorum]KAH4204941.1 hypothetical protein HBI95_141320 [Parastagonospora nodorum]KAH4220878.1 hypothetical protein HBI06_166060 [Parastagonospora nodorum]KAH4237234.1 hypothetical protein HBI05_128480 [Parastagonospora nodorum]KAH4608712.1 hypothetical protein HBH82_075140 [Parastagonospora nodorum]